MNIYEDLNEVYCQATIMMINDIANKTKERRQNCRSSYL